MTESRPWDMGMPPKSKRGFASMSPERRKELASQGGKKAQALGVGHKFNPEEAAAAGRLGGKAKGIAMRNEKEHKQNAEN